MNNSIPMSLERAWKLRAEMRLCHHLFAANNHRVLGDHGAWAVSANVKDTGEVIRCFSESDWEKIKERFGWKS